MAGDGGSFAGAEYVLGQDDHDVVIGSKAGANTGEGGAKEGHTTPESTVVFMEHEAGDVSDVTEEASQRKSLASQQQYFKQPERSPSTHKEEHGDGDGSIPSSDTDAGGGAIKAEGRPDNMSGSTTASARSTGTGNLSPLRCRKTKLMQKEAHPWEHLGITLGLPMILLFDIIVPCIIYYTWYNTRRSDWERQCREGYPSQSCPIPRPEFDKAILGYAIVSFGFGELWILVARVWRLYFHREECAPLLSRSRWELDATCWVYAVAMLMALVPFVVGSSLEMPKLYLYSPCFIMGFLGVLMAVTVCIPFKIPIGINSHARGSALRPFIYYAAEDFIAVDGLQDREFRVRYNERYETNRMFRRFFLYLTLWWILGVCVYIGCVSVVIWTLDFHYAFGLSLGVLFSYIAVWAGVSAIWTNAEMKRECKAYEEGSVDC
jgi:hypothetical protein